MTPTEVKHQEYYFKEGCYIEEWHNRETDPTMSVARVRVEPGQSTKNHSLLATTERYVILSGEATVWLSGEATKVGPKSVLTIEPEVQQSLRNDGASDLIFLAICTPRFEETNYREH